MANQQHQYKRKQTKGPSVHFFYLLPWDIDETINVCILTPKHKFI